MKKQRAGQAGRQKAKGKNQRAKVEPPANASFPVSDPTNISALQKNEARPVEADEPDLAPAVSTSDTRPESSISSSLSTTELEPLASSALSLTEAKSSALEPLSIAPEELFPTQKPQKSSPYTDRIERLLAQRGSPIVGTIAAVLSLTAFFYFFTNGMTNHYGDGIAHVNIARKVVDSPDSSLWQRYLQIGTPWLPLQTVLMMPLVANDGLWRNGAAGSLISMAAFIIAAIMMFQIARNLYRQEDARLATWMPVVSLAIFVLNPSALFMQSTPMTETVFMAAIAAAVFCLQRWVMEPTPKRLIIAGVAMTIATLARYEAWPVAALSVLVVAFASQGAWKNRLTNAALFAGLVVVGPLYWLWHNWAIFGNALEFLSGPHSARGIFLQEEARLGWAKVFIGHPLVSMVWMAITAAVCVGPLTLLLGGLGFVTFAVLKRRSLTEFLPAALLAIPFLFHAFSVSRGEIQIFPFSAFGLLNVRYGLPHLLAIAAFAPAVIWWFKPRTRRLALALIGALVILQYGNLISEGPSQLAVYQEGYRNGVNSVRAREWMHTAVWLTANPPGQNVWMNTGALGPVVPRGGLRFAQIIHEGSLRSHEIKDTIPADVSMIIYQEGDPVASQLKNNATLAQDFAAHFQQTFAYDSIRIFTRK